MITLKTRFLTAFGVSVAVLLTIVLLSPVLFGCFGLLSNSDNGDILRLLVVSSVNEESGRVLAFFLSWLAVSVLAAAAVVTFLLFTLERKVTRPVEELTAAADKICVGEFDVEIIGADEKEIDDLCRSLDDLRLKLREREAREQVILDDRRLLIANISHDMRTPVTTILGYLQAIEDGVASSPEQIENGYRQIRAKAEFLRYLAEDMSEYSDLESGRLRYNFEDMELKSFLDDMAEEYREPLESRGFQFGLSLPSEEIFIRGDRRRLQRVMQNLLSNAEKYNRPGGEIAVSLEAEGDYVYIMVADSGVGIPESSLKKVFDSFYREDDVRGLADGHGLGLAIARRIVAAHRGKIWLQSREGEGTCAFLALPRKNRYQQEERS